METDKNFARDRQLDQLMGWVDEQIGNGNVPRFSDVIDYARVEDSYKGLKPKMITARLRLHKNYFMSASQQRPARRSRKYRPVLTNALGTLHCDIGYFSISEHYATPRTYRAGFLVCKDVLSRFIYAVPLKMAKSSQALLAAFETVFDRHEKIFGSQGHKIISISFDQERAVLSHQVQKFFKEKQVAFHAFKFSSSKAKSAESAIKQIRSTLTRLVASQPDKRWWIHLQNVADILNARPIVVAGKKMSFSPRDVNLGNLAAFRKELHKKAPYYDLNQFDLHPALANFAFSIGDLVRPKLIVTSAALIGSKRSEVALSKTIFLVQKQFAYISVGYHLSKAYLCVALNNPEESELFDEGDIVPTTSD